MKNLLKYLVIIQLTSLVCNGQLIKPNNSYGIIWNRLRADSTLFFATYCGVPIGTMGLHSTDQHMAAIYFDTCGHKMYNYDPSTGNWSTVGNMTLQQVTREGKKTVDTTILGGLRTRHILTDTTSEPDFEILLIPDTQNWTQYDPEMWDSVMKWVRDSSSYYNIKAWLGLGDIVNIGNTTQFALASNYYATLDSLNIPYLATIGNHDYNDLTSPTLLARLSSNYNTYFGPSRYSGKSWYGGSFPAGKNDNSYIKFSVGSHKYLGLSLEYLPTDSSLNWAQSILDSNTDREVILVTHAYITLYGERATDTTAEVTPAGMGNNGQQLWDKFIKKNRQIFLTGNGHFIPYDLGNWGGYQRLTEAGLQGNTIDQIFIDLQSDTLYGKAAGEGFLMRLKFRPSLGRIEVRVYSPYFHQDDPRFTQYSIDYPAIISNAAMGVDSVSGRLSVSGNARFSADISNTKLKKWRMLTTEKNGLITTVENGSNKQFWMATGTDTKSVWHTLDSTDLPVGSNNYIKNYNLVGNVPTSHLIPQQGQFFIKDSTFPNYNGAIVAISVFKNFQPLLAGIPCEFIAASGGSNFNISSQRASVNTAGANFCFYKTRASDFTTPTDITSGDLIGNINWMASHDGGFINILAQAHGLTEQTGPTAVGLVWATTNTSGTFADRMHLNANGNLYIGGTNSANAYRLNVNGNAAISSLSTVGTAPSTTGTTNIAIVDANGMLSFGQTTTATPTISTGTAAPTTTPAKVGDIYVDTTNKKLYFAAGISSSSDWIIAN